MTTSPDIGRALTEIVGAGHVLSGDRVRPYTVEGLTPRWVAHPGSVEEVSRCLGLASAHGLAVAPTGKGTRLHWGGAPRALDLVLSLRRLDRIVTYEPADLTVSVEAGVTVGALQAHIRPHRQLFPLDPPLAERSTIGGLIATAPGGPYRARYGTIRDLLLGVTVVRADGTLVTGGGRVVKNATGYDMPKLHIGALGTLGVVVGAHLRLHPAPPAEATWRLDFASLDAALEAALGIMDAAIVVSRLQLLDEGTLAALGEGRSPAAALGVTIGSVPEGVRAQGVRVADVAGWHGGAVRTVPDADPWWERVRESAWAAGADHVMTLRVGVRPADTVKALRGIEAVAGDRVTSRATAEVANGVVHLTLSGPGLREGGTLLARVREGLAALQATCVVEHAPPAAKRSLDVWGGVGPALEVMRRLKQEMDPQAVLNPGRYVGGL